MALTDENGSGFNVNMPVVPAYGGGYGNQGGFGFGGDWAWILLLLVLGGGWGGFGGFGMGGAMMGMGMMGMDYLYPWLNNSQNINDGFRDQQLSTQISGIQSAVTSGFGDTALGIAGVNQNICQTGNGIVGAVTGAQSAITQQLYNNEIASLERSFAAQTQASDCCCKTQSNIADLKYTVATEACADRAAVGDALQNITMQNMGNTNALVTAIRDGIQSIKDDLCADRLEAERRENSNLRTQLSMAQLAASQTAQTAQILAGQAAEIDGVYNRLKNCPVPTTPVYGNQPIFTCPNNNSGCGCGSF